MPSVARPANEVADLDQILARLPEATPQPSLDKVRLHDRLLGAVDPRTSARSGRTIELTVDACSLYWFDRDSGQAIGRGPSHRTPARPEARLAPA